MREQSVITRNSNTITKRFKNQNSYETEKSIYEKNLSYIPKLISSDDKKQSLTIQRIPMSLFDLSPAERVKYYPEIKKLKKRFENDTGLFHNDLHFKNILINDRGKLFLIDFEFTSKEPTKKVEQKEFLEKVNKPRSYSRYRN